MPERFRGDELLTMGRYTNPASLTLPYPTNSEGVSNKQLCNTFSHSSRISHYMSTGMLNSTHSLSRESELSLAVTGWPNKNRTFYEILNFFSHYRYMVIILFLLSVQKL